MLSARSYVIINTFNRYIKNFRWAFHRSPGRETQLKIMEMLEAEPDKLYVENVRAFFDVPRENAEYLCDQAVKAGILVKKIGLSCPNDQRIIAVLDGNVAPDEIISCDVCQSLEMEKSSFNPGELGQITFYQAVG